MTEGLNKDSADLLVQQVWAYRCWALSHGGWAYRGRDWAWR